MLGGLVREREKGGERERQELDILKGREIQGR
jgi:hypothetical protein